MPCLIFFDIVGWEIYKKNITLYFTVVVEIKL